VSPEGGELGGKVLVGPPIDSGLFVGTPDPDGGSLGGQVGAYFAGSFVGAPDREGGELGG
jgi:hypothetical protein